MAKIEIIREAEGSPNSVESLEVIVWGTCGHLGQQFYIGSGVNFDASGNFWIEIRYSLQDIPLFYTRSILHYLFSCDQAKLEQDLDKFLKGDFDKFGFVDVLPKTSIMLSCRKQTYLAGKNDHESQEFVEYFLKVSADVGAVFGGNAPGERSIDFCIDDIQIEEGARFMRELIHEMSEASQGRHPDPSSMAPGHSDWPFSLQLNRQAYDMISTGYQGAYFSNPLLVEAFDSWMAEIPAGACILDAGCGHGDPVITRLLEKGFNVTGSDLSPVMLAEARQQFPAARFWESAITSIYAEAIFDGACSFSSMLYLDPIELFHSIHRLYCALKPGGSLFLYSYDLHPGYRGEPYHVDLKHWMWGDTYGVQETTLALEEHGFFNVEKTLDISNESER